MHQIRRSAVALSFWCIGALAAPFDSPPDTPDLRVSGSMDLHIMRIVKSSAIPNIETDRPFLNRAWIQYASGAMNAEKDIGPRLTLRTGIGGMIASDIQGIEVNWTKISRHAAAQLNVASAGFKLGDTGRPCAEITAGFFGYSYTRVHDFGGYLFTAGLHPMYLTSSGGWANIAGLLMRAKAPALIRHDIVINLETDRSPYMDISAAYVPTLKIGEKLELGAGVKFHRFLHAANTAKDSQLVYTSYAVDTTITVVDGVEVVNEQRVRMPYGGIMAAARVLFDPLETFGITGSFWGADDLRVYGEAAVLGLKDYPLSIAAKGYPDISERVAAMAGINIPTHPLIANGAFPLAVGLFLVGIEPDTVLFDTITDADDNITGIDTVTEQRGFARKPARPVIWAAAAALSGAGTFLLERFIGRPFRLDAVAVEVEYCGSPYDNNHDGLSGLPEFVVAFDQLKGRRTQNEKWHADDWRWAVVANKTLLRRFSLGAKVASDHVRLRDPSGWYLNIERMFAFYEWYWELGFSVSF